MVNRMKAWEAWAILLEFINIVGKVLTCCPDAFILGALLMKGNAVY
jgi:hypothetical protein